MSIFRDETGRRGAAVRLATLLGLSVAIASLGTFLASVFPAPWTRSAQLEEPAPQPRAPLPQPAPPPSKRAQDRAREQAFKAEAGRLEQLLTQAERAQKKRKPEAPGQPVLAGFYVNWDAQSLASLQAHRDQLTHVMPEWIHVGPDGKLVIEEDHRIDALVEQLAVMPTVSNYGDGRFSGRWRSPSWARTPHARTRGAPARRVPGPAGQASTSTSRGFSRMSSGSSSRSWSRWRRRCCTRRASISPSTCRVRTRACRSSGSPPPRLLVLMAYDEHSANDHPGAIATPDGVLGSAAAYLKRAPADKLVMALGAYGYDWPVDADGDAARPAEELSYAQALSLARENQVPIDWDAGSRTSSFEYDDDDTHEKHEVHFLDAPAALTQLQALSALPLRGTAIGGSAPRTPSCSASSRRRRASARSIRRRRG